MYEIFDFLDFCQAYETFVNLNRRFQILFIHFTLPIKIKVLSVSKLTFQYYHRQIILPNQHRIKSLHLSNPFLIDQVFASICNGLKLTQLETLILNKIQSTYLEYLLVLPYLLSLIIDCEDQIDNKNNLYYEIFRLPRLKYCKLSINEINQSEPLPLATNECSPIEHLILMNTYPLYDLNNLLSYLPHLKKLSIQSSNSLSIREIQLNSLASVHLTHVSLHGPDIPFNVFEILVQSLFNQVQVLHMLSCYRMEYLDADRWQILIQSHMAQLRIFDINVQINLHYLRNMFGMISQISKFNCSFWTEHKWFFEHRIFDNGNLVFNFFQSIHTEGKNIDEHINRQKMIINSVDQIEIHNGKGELYCANYFPNVTELIIWFRLYDKSTNLDSTRLNNILPLNKLKKIIISSYFDDFSSIIKLLQYTINIATFEIGRVSFKNLDFISMEQSDAFRFVSQTNQIRNLIIHDW